MSLTNANIQLKLNQLEKSIVGIQTTLKTMQDNIDSRIHLSELQKQKEELVLLIRDNSELIIDLQRKLAKVLLPEETQYFLEEGDVETFKSNFSKLKAMMARFEKLYNNLVSYVSSNS